MAGQNTPMADVLHDDFSTAVLQALVQEAQAGKHKQVRGLAGNAGVSLPRLCKLLGLRASTVMRQLTLMGDVCGAGLLRVEQHEGRFMVQLTEAGCRLAHASDDAAETR